MNAGFVDAVGMLPMPNARSLARKRIDGACCVWCGGTAVMDLGPRLSVVDGALKRWEPRACRPCAAREAARVYGIHIQSCARCTHHDYCPDARALHALSREGQ